MSFPKNMKKRIKGNNCLNWLIIEYNNRMIRKVLQLWEENKIFRYITVYFIFFFTYYILNFQNLSHWSLSGDDLFSLSNSIPNLPSLLINIVSQFGGQYRHTTYYLFHFYKLLLPNFFLIFKTHGLLLSLIPTLLFISLESKLNKLKTILIIVPIFFTPIFYYHTYTISSLANILICITSLIELYYFINYKNLKHIKYDVFFLLIALISFTIKENFIIPLTIFCFVQLLEYNTSRLKSFSFISISIIIFLVYLILRANVYQKDYHFIFSTKNLYYTCSHIFAWLVNYPKGWQYGAPIRYKIIQLSISLFYFLFLLYTLIKNFIKNRIITLALIIFSLVSICLYLFLTDVLVYYLDVSYILLIIFISKANDILIKRKKNTYSNIYILIWFLLNFSNLLIIKPQWLKYSFVANANTSAINYRKILEQNNYLKYDQICIINHHRGGFGTQDGILAQHLSGKNMSIISVKETSLPPICQNDQSLNLVNDAWDYHLYIDQ